ncbi:MAG: protein kinase [Blastocatellia bacterium]|nr:protein kinase [Blastocatellia bacterium]
MSEVYLAEDTELDRLIALKILHDDVATNDDRVGRFVQEAKAASALNHPNILTVHEIGTFKELRFITTEYIDGETLYERLSRQKMSFTSALDIAIQIASALDAAHGAGIVHRDIKPENVMIRPDGLVKILDFGIAKLAEPQESYGRFDKGEKVSMARKATIPGMIIGSANYMSPEQALGKEVDARSDIFSFGNVLYEMLARKMAFDGENAVDVIGAILHKEPIPLNQILPELPDQIGRIVDKMLRKDLGERYQTAKDLKMDLKDAKQDLEFQDKLSHETRPHREEIKTQMMQVATTDVPNPVTLAEFIARGGNKNKSGMLLTLVSIMAVAAALIYFTALRARPAALTDKDTILLADIENSTGDPVFDGALKQGLAVTLGQSPFLDIFPDSRVRQTLLLMQRGQDERVSEQVAREICQRQGLKAFLTGSIAPLGSNYVIMLKAVNAQSGDEIAREQTEADSKEAVLTALSGAAIRMRAHLGESLSSIQKFDAPIEQATTASLDALKAYSLGLEQASNGNYAKAVPFYERAVELDPTFAIGFQALARDQFNTGFLNEAIGSAIRAFELRERTSENEKLHIDLFYHRAVINDLEKAIEVGEVWKKTYPRFWRPYHSLADIYLEVGEFEKAAENGREAVRLNPKVAAAYSNYAGGLMFLNRFDEAEQVYKQAFDNNLDAPEYHWYLYWIAYSRGDTNGMRQQMDWLQTGSYERWAFVLQAQTAALGGQWRRSQELLERAIKMFEDRGMKGLVAWTSVRWAQTGASFGDCRSAKQNVARTLSNSQDATFSGSMSVLALCGDSAQALANTKRLAEIYPYDTRFNHIWLPVAKAALELQRGEPARALELLAPVTRYEGAADFQPQYLRGLCYLRLGQGTEAGAEFRKILDRRGQTEVLVSTLYPLARLGMARSAAVTGDTALARKSYEEFFELWKDADPDLPVLIEARKEYANMKIEYQ